MPELKDIFVKFSNSMPGGGAPCFVSRGGVLYTTIVPRGEVFAPFESCPGGGGMVLGETDTCITKLPQASERSDERT